MTEHDANSDPVDEAITRVGELASSAADLAAEPGSAVVPKGVSQAEAVKAGMVEKRASLLRHKQQVEQAAADATALVEAQMAELRRKLDEQMALLQPALEQLALLEDGVDALNIYLGRDEEIIPLLEGERAPADTTVSVRQLVLAMDEESLLFTDRDGMDFRDIDAFADWLRRDVSHLDTLLPEEKGIVALIPRRAAKDYGDPWLQDAADAANNVTFWLIRNGQSAWLTTVPFSVGKHTVPAPKEFTDLFIKKGHFGQPDEKLEPGSAAWVKAEKAADRRTRHYMKVALLLQGILDRTTALHPHEGVSFLDQSHYEQGRVRVILDGENTLTDGRPSFRQWRDAHVAMMHEGMRVIGAFGQKMRLYDSRDYGRAEVRPQDSRPSSMVPYNVRASNRAYYDWEFNFERLDKSVFDGETFEWRAPKQRATGYLSNSDAWWLPLDTISEDDIRYYMQARTQRHDYIDMIPVLQVALLIKEAERAVEAPFRAALVGLLSKDADLDSSEKAAHELITWFKTANKHHRALTDDDAKAAKVILTEARRRARGSKQDAGLVEQLRAAHPDAMVIARRSSDFVVVTPEQRMYPSASRDVFARLHIYTTGGALKETREWVTLTRAQTARWTILHHSDEWASWQFNPSLQHHYTDDEMTEVVDELRQQYPRLFVVRIESDKEMTCASGRAYEWSEEVGLRDLTFYVQRDGERVILQRSYSGMAESSSHFGTPSWKVRWSGHAKPESDLWRDEAIEAQALAQWEEDNERREHANQARNRAIHIASGLERVWEAAAEAQLRDRFVEDFGDVSLWEGHRKTIKLPTYPHRWEGDQMFRERLADLYLHDSQADVTGLTVQEILDLADDMGAPRTRIGAAVHSRQRTVVDESLLALVPLPASPK